MAIHFDVNQTPSTFAECAFRLKQIMVTAGWVVKSSSDGTTFNSTGDQITSANTGAGGMNNNNAWFRIQDPAGGREFTLQKGGAATYQVK